MAIIVQPNRSGSRTFMIFSVLAVLTLVAIGGYYLFFAPIPLIETILPANLQSVSALKGLQFNPEGILKSAFLNPVKPSRTIDLPVVETGTIGRTDPFAAF